MLPPERKAPRTKLALQQSFSSTPRLMCSASVSVASVPKARKTAWIFSGSVMVKLRFLVAEGAGSWSKVTPKARRKSRGRASASSAPPVMMRISWALKVLQNSSMP